MQDYDPELFFTKLKGLPEPSLLELIEDSTYINEYQIACFVDYFDKLSPRSLFAQEVYDCCGTGGDQANTFNISTCAAIVAAGCGVKVCKNGGRSSTSKTGSVDVLEALGVDLNKPEVTKKMSLERFCLSFHHAQKVTETLAPIKKICRSYKKTSLLNLICPFLGAVKLSGQVIGVAKKAWLDKLVAVAKILVLNNYAEQIVLVQSEVNTPIGVTLLDELTSIGENLFISVTNSGVEKLITSPRDFGFKPGQLKDLEGGEKTENARIISDILSGQNFCPIKLETVCLNAALIEHLQANGGFQRTSFIDQISQKLEFTKQSLEKNIILENWRKFLQYNSSYA